MNKKVLLTGLLSTSLVAVGPLSPAEAGPISVNVLPEAFEGGVDEMDAGDVAGEVPLANWNNVVFPSGSVTSFSVGAGELVDADGNTTQTTLDFSSDGDSSQQSFLGRPVENDTPDQHMMNSGAVAFGGAQVQTWTFEDLPADLAENFEVLVYWGGTPSAAGEDDDIRTKYTINGESFVLRYQEGAEPADPEVEHWLQPPANGEFVLGTGTDGTTATFGPNYVLFSGLSGDSFDLTVERATGSDSRPGLSGIQIIPEPASLALMCLGSLLLIRRQRRA